MTRDESLALCAQSQRAPLEGLLAWWDGDAPCCILHGPGLAGKSWISWVLEQTLRGRAQVSRLTIDPALETAEELGAIRALHTALLSHEWSAQDVAAPIAGVNGPYGWLATIRSELWSPSDARRLLVVDGLDNLYSWQRIAQLLDAQAEYRFVLVIGGDEAAARDWQQRLRWKADDTWRVSMSALSAAEAARVGTPVWVRRALDAVSLDVYVRTHLALPLHLELLALLAEALAPVHAEDLARVSGAALTDVEAALRTLRDGTLRDGTLRDGTLPEATPPEATQHDAKANFAHRHGSNNADDEASGSGPIGRDPSTQGWSWRTPAFGLQLRASYPEHCQRAWTAWARVAKRAVERPTAENEAGAGNDVRYSVNCGHYAFRYATAYASALDSETLQAFVAVDWYRSRSAASDFICDAERVRNAAADRLTQGACRSQTAAPTRLFVGSALAQAAVFDDARGNTAAASVDDVLVARMEALVQIGMALPIEARTATTERAIRLAQKNRERGVEALLRARRAWGAELSRPLSKALLDTLESEPTWSTLSPLSALQLAAGLDGNQTLLAYANRHARKALQDGLIGQLLPFAEQLASLSTQDWVDGVLALQRRPSNEAFDACLKLQIPQAWHQAVPVSEGILEQSETLADGTLRLLILKSLLPLLKPRERELAAALARELWTSRAHTVESYPEVGIAVLAGLGFDALQALARAESSSVRAGVVGALLLKAQPDAALEVALSLRSDQRLRYVARVALWCKRYAPERWPELHARVVRLLATSGEGSFSLIIDPDIAEFELDVEVLTELATSHGSYHSVVALARILRNVPEARSETAIARLLTLMSGEEDVAALGEVVACAHWFTPADAARLFVRHLNHGWMHESGLVGVLSGEVGIGALAPLLVAVGDDAANAAAQLIFDSPWFGAFAAP